MRPLAGSKAQGFSWEDWAETQTLGRSLGCNQPPLQSVPAMPGVQAGSREGRSVVEHLPRTLTQQALESTQPILVSAGNSRHLEAGMGGRIKEDFLEPSITPTRASSKHGSIREMKISECSRNETADHQPDCAQSCLLAFWRQQEREGLFSGVFQSPRWGSVQECAGTEGGWWGM